MPKIKFPEKAEQAMVKARLHKQYVAALIYAVILLAIGVSLTIFTAVGRVTENEFVLIAFYCILYGTSIIGMIWVMFYVRTNRNSSIEAIENGNFSAETVVYSIRGEVVSRYLRLGVLLFSSMSVAFFASHCFQLVVEMQFTAGNIILNCFRIAFILVQAVFLLVLHRLVLFTKTRPFKFLALHLLAANLCTLIHMLGLSVVPSTQKGQFYNSEWSVSSSKIMNYFLPAVVEFSVVSAVILYDLANRTGHVNQVKPHRKINEEFKMRRSIVWKVIATLMAICVAGLVVGMGLSGYRLGWIRYAVHMVESALIFLLGLILCGVGIKYIRRLKFTVSLSRTDLEENLLLATAFATIVYLVASVVICIGHMIMNPALGWQDSQLLRGHLALLLIQFCHLILQTYFLQDCFYRCCHDQELRQQRPGRSILIMVVAVNVSLWLIHSFQVKDNDPLFKFNEVNAGVTNMTGIFNIMRVTLPFVMLYYFQSAICVVMTYRRIYEDEVTRFERLLRWANQNGELFSQKNYLESKTGGLGRDTDESDELSTITFERGFDDGVLDQHKITQYGLYKDGKVDPMAVAKAKIMEAQRKQAQEHQIPRNDSPVQQSTQQKRVSNNFSPQLTGLHTYSPSDSDKEDLPAKAMVYINKPDTFSWEQQELDDNNILSNFNDEMLTMQEPSATFRHEDEEFRWDQAAPVYPGQTGPQHGSAASEGVAAAPSTSLKSDSVTQEGHEEGQPSATATSKQAGDAGDTLEDANMSQTVEREPGTQPSPGSLVD